MLHETNLWGHRSRQHSRTKVPKCRMSLPVTALSSCWSLFSLLLMISAAWVCPHRPKNIRWERLYTLTVLQFPIVELFFNGGNSSPTIQTLLQFSISAAASTLCRTFFMYGSSERGIFRSCRLPRLRFGIRNTVINAAKQRRLLTFAGNQQLVVEQVPKLITIMNHVQLLGFWWTIIGFQPPSIVGLSSAIPPINTWVHWSPVLVHPNNSAFSILSSDSKNTLYVCNGLGCWKIHCRTPRIGRDLKFAPANGCKRKQ